MVKIQHLIFVFFSLVRFPCDTVSHLTFLIFLTLRIWKPPPNEGSYTELCERDRGWCSGIQLCALLTTFINSNNPSVQIELNESKSTLEKEQYFPKSDKTFAKLLCSDAVSKRRY